MNDFGEFLFKLRKENGMTQAELAQALGVTNKAVSKWETGEAMPETALLLPISRIFGVALSPLPRVKIRSFILCCSKPASAFSLRFPSSSSSTETPNMREIGKSKAVSGMASPVSHLDTALFVTPSACASSA